MKSLKIMKLKLLEKRRSREGAWIEIEDIFKLGFVTIVAPARERGLKYHIIANFNTTGMSLPRGSVD